MKGCFFSPTPGPKRVPGNRCRLHTENTVARNGRRHSPRAWAAQCSTDSPGTSNYSKNKQRNKHYHPDGVVVACSV